MVQHSRGSKPYTTGTLQEISSTVEKEPAKKKKGGKERKGKAKNKKKAKKSTRVYEIMEEEMKGKEDTKKTKTNERGRVEQSVVGVLSFDVGRSSIFGTVKMR